MTDPRLLLIDMTPIGGAAAAGSPEAACFCDWRENALLHLRANDEQVLIGAPGAPGAAPAPVAPDEKTAGALLDAFRPEVVLYRPVPYNARLHDFAMMLLERSDAPLALWLTDGWPARLRAQAGADHEWIGAEVETLAGRAGATIAVPGETADVFAGPSHSGTAEKARDISHPDLGAMKSDVKSKLAQVADRLHAGYEPPAQTSVQFDECEFVFGLLQTDEDGKDRQKVMIDVGAHEGASLRSFARAGWRVVAFEPDRKNRRVLEAVAYDLKDVAIRSDAVGATQQRSVPFFRSDVSSGISSLSAFHESHKQAAHVDVTTLDAALKEEGVAAVDFLKIDVEGHEMDVLDGFDIRHMRPRAIVAEFEDAKTTQLSDAAKRYTMADLADRLVAAGYAVWVSEWRPIQQYGAVHEWRRLRRYPCEAAPGGWGNLIALLAPPPQAVMDAAFAAALTGAASGAGAQAALAAIAPQEANSLRRRISRWIWTNYPHIAIRLRFLLQAFRGWRRA